MAADTLTDAQARLLREASGTIAIQPRSDRALCAAESLWSRDLLFTVVGRLFSITAAGREALARYDAANDGVSPSAARHAEAGGRRG